LPESEGKEEEEYIEGKKRSAGVHGAL